MFGKLTNPSMKWSFQACFSGLQHHNLHYCELATWYYMLDGVLTLTYQSAPPAPGRRWCGKSRCRSVRGWSLCISETRPRWRPRPPGSAIGRIETPGDAAGLVGIPCHAPLRKQMKTRHGNEISSSDFTFLVGKETVKMWFYKLLVRTKKVCDLVFRMAIYRNTWNKHGICPWMQKMEKTNAFISFQFSLLLQSISRCR